MVNSVDIMQQLTIVLTFWTLGWCCLAKAWCDKIGAIPNNISSHLLGNAIAYASNCYSKLLKKL